MQDDGYTRRFTPDEIAEARKQVAALRGSVPGWLHVKSECGECGSTEADARALWAMRTVDRAEEFGWQFCWVTGTKRFALLVTRPDVTTLAGATVGGAFEGDTKEAARMAVAEALVAADNSLDPESK